jgi:hypothetical protein
MNLLILQHLSKIGIDLGAEPPTAKSPPPSHGHRPTIEEVPEDEDSPAQSNECFVFIESFPTEFKAGAPCGIGAPKFETIHQQQQDQGKSNWGPFEDEDEWELAEWLIKNVGQTQTDKFLKLPIVSLPD